MRLTKNKAKQEYERLRVPEPALGSEKISLDQKPKTQTELTEQRKQIGLNFNLQTFKTFSFTKDNFVFIFLQKHNFRNEVSHQSS